MGLQNRRGVQVCLREANHRGGPALYGGGVIVFERDHVQWVPEQSEDTVRKAWTLLCRVALVVILSGCGQNQNPTSPATSATSDRPEAAPTELPLVSITPRQPEPQAEPALPEPGSPQVILQEIQRLRLLPLPNALQTESDAEGTEQPAPEVLKEQLARARTVRRERNQQVVQMATEVISLTAKDPRLESEFQAAVSYLLDARLQLALQGDEESLHALYDAAEAFYQKKPDSPAAAEAQLTLVNLAHAHMLRYGKSEPRWLEEFSRQAQLYATRFPHEQSKALPLLMAAGKSCELHGLEAEAKTCYGIIQAKFPETPQAIQCTGILRRLNLPGQPLQFAGPTLDGNLVNIDDYVGKAVVVIFWATHVEPFREQLARLQAVTDKYKKYIQVLSVSLDSEEAEIDAFLEETGLTWPVIFHVEPTKRGWNAPLASYYGINVLPTIWIVDPQGKVASTQVTAENLETQLREVLLKHLNAGRPAGGGQEAPK